MSNDIESAARSMMASPQGLKIIKGLDKFNTAISGESGTQLLHMLSGEGGDALKAAAKAAADAPKDPGRALLSSLLSSKDGASLAAKIIEIIGV